MIDQLPSASLKDIAAVYINSRDSCELNGEWILRMGAIRYVGKIDNHALAQKTLAYILNLVHKAQVIPYCVVDCISERAPKMSG